MSPDTVIGSQTGHAGENAPRRTDSAIKAARIVEVTGDLPPMPHIAAQVIDKLADANATPREIHHIIIKDQALAARVLKVANSPYYGACRSIATLRDAVMFMGFDAIRSLIMTAVLKGMFSNVSLSEKLLWEHSVGSAFAARKVGEEVGYPRKEEAFLAGLMHDVGKTVLFLRAPTVMRDIMEEVYNDDGADFFSVEQEKLGFTHSDVGRIIANKWCFAPNIEDAIGSHHQTEDGGPPGELTRIVSLANAICHKLEVGPTRRPDLDLSELESTKAFKLSPLSIETILYSVKETLLSSESEGI